MCHFKVTLCRHSKSASKYCPLYKSIDCNTEGELKTAPFDLHTMDELPCAGRHNKTFRSALMPLQKNANTCRRKHTHAHPNQTQTHTQTVTNTHTLHSVLHCSTPTHPSPKFTHSLYMYRTSFEQNSLSISGSIESFERRIHYAGGHRVVTLW